MARFNAENIDNYGSQSSGGKYFSLKDDGDVARVRFMYGGAEDIEGFSIHRVQVGDREQNINCLREYNSPIDDCPFCKAGMKLYTKLFVPLYNEDTQQVQIWERGKKFLSKLSSICSRYPDLASHIFEIERNGAKGEQTTTYEVYEVDKDNTTLDDLPEVPEILGSSFVLSKTAEEMNDYLEIGSFPDNEEKPVRRQSSSRDSGGRRTPANRGRGDRF